MAKPKNYYIRYKRLELENYVNHPESCVKKVHKVEKLIFGSNVVNNFKESVLRILSRKIGKYDRNLEGVVLDFRNTKILNMQTGIRYDSAYSVVNIETNFYIFAPRKDVLVDGIVKHINIQKMETIISVVIYRVFNVKVTFKGCIKKNDVHHNKEIKIRIKEFHFENEIPYIEGEMVGMSSMSNTRKVFDDIPDSGISESSIHNEHGDDDSDNESEKYELDQSSIKIKQERESSTEPSTSITSTKRHAKRKLEDNYDLPPLKKIKQEKLSDDDSLHNHITTKHNDSETDYNGSAKKDKKRKSQGEMNLSSSVNDFNSSTCSTDKLPKKKKKKKHNAEDDFESSLQMLLDSSITIKKEK
ncbi:probable DNA-directed RNA polymerase I subunit RPA43 [Chironomus tepperi]|uniref:probable DNA-directed RNA polymerase I subunit RPA43 n=1 Tax=Chironomus tepperi TaxID=113505 RepID=UPI00391F5AE0